MFYDIFHLYTMAFYKVDPDILGGFCFHHGYLPYPQLLFQGFGNGGKIITIVTRLMNIFFLNYKTLVVYFVLIKALVIQNMKLIKYKVRIIKFATVLSYVTLPCSVSHKHHFKQYLLKTLLFYQRVETIV